MQVRVNYYVRELYGDPGTYKDAWEGPLGVLARQGPAQLFLHPLLEKVRIMRPHDASDILSLRDFYPVLIVLQFVLTLTLQLISSFQVLDLKWVLFARTHFLVMELWSVQTESKILKLVLIFLLFNHYYFAFLEYQWMLIWSGC